MAITFHPLGQFSLTAAWVALLLRAWREAETGEIARGRRSTTRLQPPDAT
jgi:hypothetical protein